MKTHQEYHLLHAIIIFSYISKKQSRKEEFTTMRIEHIAIWVDNLETMRKFYSDYFSALSGEKYVNPKKGYSSYFLKFPGSETRIELMNRHDIVNEPYKRGFMKGVAHLAFSVGSKVLVDSLTERLRADNFSIESEPRTTGDGYYESVVLDPEGNYVEIAV
jgi:lactoylglutathione lyase